MDFESISVAFDRQFTTLHNRAQLLLGICGVLISASVLVTAGRFIGGRGLFLAPKAGQTPISAAIRPAPMAATSASWSRSVWSA
jgi:hypothetical protein